MPTMHLYTGVCNVCISTLLARFCTQSSITDEREHAYRISLCTRAQMEMVNFRLRGARRLIL